MENILSWIIFIPLIGVLLLLFLDNGKAEAVKQVAFVTSLFDFFLSLSLYTNFDASTARFQFVEARGWIRDWGVSYHLGLDGISLFLVILTTFLTAISILASWGVSKRIKEYMISMLLLEVGMLGVFVALDLFLFYVFWEVMLIPMYLLIGVWGGPRRIYAAVKFFIYTMVGSVLMLVAILVLYFMNYKATGVYTFDLQEIYKLSIPVSTQMWLFAAFGLAFAIKVPIFPFHTWLPDAHVEAPTAGSVILAGVLLKMGTYGFIRFSLPLFPEASHAFVPLIAALAIAGIIYGALVAMVQEDLKKLVAYSSVSHLGFIILGIFVFNIQGLEGGILQMINHGLSTGALFLLVGIIYERRHTRLIKDFGGLTGPMPVFAVFFMIMTLSSIGLPGMNGFVGEFLILLGTFASNKIYAALAATGVILSACYMLWMFQRVMFNACSNPENKTLPDMSPRELATLVPITILVFWIGIYPSPFLSKMETSVTHLLHQVQDKRVVMMVQEPANQNIAMNRENPGRELPQIHGKEKGEKL